MPTMVLIFEYSSVRPLSVTSCDVIVCGISDVSGHIGSAVVSSVVS